MTPWPALALALATIPAADAAPKLTYVLQPDGAMLHVELVLSHFGPEIDLELPTRWGNAVELHRGVTNLRALEGQLRRADDEGAAKVQTIQGRARIAYDLVQDWSGSLRESVRHRPQLDSVHLEINTANSLVHPQLDLAEPVDCSFEWRIPAGWTLATSFGTTVSLRTGNISGSADPGMRSRMRCSQPVIFV